MRGLFDYAHSELKADWLDVFLCAEAFFFLGSSGGIFATPQALGTPLLSTNYPITFPGHSSQDIFIPKVVRSSKTQELLSFREILSPPLWQLEEGAKLIELGLTSIPNTQEEIRQATEEMIGVREGHFIYTDHDEKLQEQFRALYALQGGISICRIGRDFLRKYSHLL
jgi:putative glycosyltransferase (TIGR04372 family)